MQAYAHEILHLSLLHATLEFLLFRAIESSQALADAGCVDLS